MHDVSFKRILSTLDVYTLALCPQSGGDCFGLESRYSTGTRVKSGVSSIFKHQTAGQLTATTAD